MSYKSFCFIAATFLLVLSACQDGRSPGWIDTQRLLQAETQPENWMSLGRNFEQQQNSPLELINEGNVQQLGLAWEFTLPTRGRIPRGQEATPIVVDGILYTSGAWSMVYALDAKTGKEIWRYDPQVDGNHARNACCDVVNRGVQVWKGRVYIATLDGYLACLDAATGKVIWKIDTITDRKRAYTITGAPQVAGDVIVIGNSGGEFGVRGYITAYSLETGKQAWRFFIVPGDPKKGFEHPEMEMAAKTWDPDSHWESGGGGTVWGQMAYDPQLNLLYVGTGNSSPYPIWIRSPKGGDNLFLCSILAINPNTGRLAWHYQTTPGEIWDYTSTANIILADLNIKGKQKKVLMQAPKNGFFYVLDRTNGELISAEKYVPANWASHIDLKTGRPANTQTANYQDASKYIAPNVYGGHSWQPMSYSPQTGLVYIPARENGMIWSSVEQYTYRSGEQNTGVNYLKDSLRGEMLKAWNPVTQKEVWRVNLSATSNGGVLSTASNLVFQGTASGHFRVYQANSGKLLHELEVGTGIMAAPMTYRIDGEQYVAVMAGYGGNAIQFHTAESAAHRRANTGRILAFKLNGGKVPLPPERVIPAIQAPPQRKYTAASVEAGQGLFFRFCAYCHNAYLNPVRYSLMPDLTNMAPEVHEQFNTIVQKGTLSQFGMARFSDLMTADEVEAVHDFLTAEQAKRWAQK